ncbi:hypothetical protein PIB30_086008 [Stylosanthes scabra]|uniref:Uncharacterized protein n=1 Tax=Stylosanthes scabra TaxID=79078 RepID=A0ABU6XS27_9FABA|nr:hypothetical protein [Stylosanthes scabra]
MIYSKGVIPASSVPLIIGDVDDSDTAFGPPDVREQVSQLRKAYSDMYSFLELMRSGGSGSAAFTAMPPPPPPPPPARSPSPPPQQDRAASASQHDDDPDYV